MTSKLTAPYVRLLTVFDQQDMEQQDTSNEPISLTGQLLRSYCGTTKQGEHTLYYHSNDVHSYIVMFNYKVC